jgi:hypothetical protein
MSVLKGPAGSRVFTWAAKAALAAKAARAALAALACAAAAALAACSYASAPAGEDELSLAIQASAKPNADGTVSVVVPLPNTGGGEGASRSLNPDYIKSDIDNYEVVFRAVNAGGAKIYYKGEAKASKGYISVSVLPGLSYDVLLLAGNDKVLLAAGYRGTNDGTNGSNPETDGPVAIEAGKANFVNLNIGAIPLQWDTAISGSNSSNNVITGDNDFKFSVTGLSVGAPATATEDELVVDSAGRYIHIGATVITGVPRITTSSKLTLDFNLLSLAPLIRASPASGGYFQFSFEAQNVLISPVPGVADSEKFPEIKLAPASGSDTYTLSVGGFPTANPTLAQFTNGNLLPTADADGLLTFRLEYYAFCEEGSGGKQWFIQNGLDDELDAPSPNVSKAAPDTDTNGGGTGGAFLVRFGKGGSSNLVKAYFGLME